MSLFRRKQAQRPMISWPVERSFGDVQNIPSPYPTLYSPIASSPSTDFSFAQRWPLKDDTFDDHIVHPSPLHRAQDVSIILGVYPPPPPPKDDSPLPQVGEIYELEDETVVDFSSKEFEIQPSEPILAELDPKDIPICRTPSPVPSIRKDGSTTPCHSPPLPVYEEPVLEEPLYEEEADIYRYLSRSPPLYKDDEAVYEDVYENISPMRTTRRYSSEVRYSTTGIEPISPLRLNKRKSEYENYNKELSPLHSNPIYDEDEDLLDDLPLISTSVYDDDDDLSPLPHALYSSYNSSPLSWRSNRTSDLTMSTIATSYSQQRPSDDIYSTLSLRAKSNKSCPDSECGFDYEDYFEKIQHEIDISDDRPDDSLLAQAGRIPIFDSDGKGRPFSSIYSGDSAIGEQQMVIFVRHFFCGACQAYLRALSKAIPFSTYFSLPKPTSITIIGLGSPELINSYRKRTNCPFPIYSDPTKRLYKALGMKWVLKPGRNPDYMRGISSKAWVMSQVDEMNHIDEKLKYRGGHMLWVGGEFLFRDSEVVWCHRMKTYRGHAEIDVVKKILDVEDSASTSTSTST